MVRSLVVSLLALVIGSTAWSHDSLAPVIRRVKAGVVVVKVRHLWREGQFRESVGAGIIVDSRGYVVTNHHVIEGSEGICVQLSSGREVAASVVYSSSITEVALLRLAGKHCLPPVCFAATTELDAGDEVLAMGHPLGHTYTITRGLVSNTQREVKMPTLHTLKGLIQHSAAIGPGSSGGPLLNLKGEVLGINVAYHLEVSGVAYAIHAEAIQKLLRRHLPKDYSHDDSPSYRDTPVRQPGTFSLPQRHLG